MVTFPPWPSLRNRARRRFCWRPILRLPVRCPDRYRGQFRFHHQIRPAPFGPPSRVTRLGGGATIPACGNVNAARVEVVLTGAETGGGTISVPICAIRTPAGPLCTAGAGGTIPGLPVANAAADRTRSRLT